MLSMNINILLVKQWGTLQLMMNNLDVAVAILPDELLIACKMNTVGPSLNLLKQADLPENRSQSINIEAFCWDENCPN